MKHLIETNSIQFKIIFVPLIRSSRSKSLLRMKGDSFTIFPQPTLRLTPNPILQILLTLFLAAPFSRSTAAKLRSPTVAHIN